jgi:hypothetical protein
MLAYAAVTVILLRLALVVLAIPLALVSAWYLRASARLQRLHGETQAR